MGVIGTAREYEGKGRVTKVGLTMNFVTGQAEAHT